MIVANKATLSGIIRTPFFALPDGGFSGGIHDNFHLDPAPTPLDFGRTKPERHAEDTSPARVAEPSFRAARVARGPSVFWRTARHCHFYGSLRRSPSAKLPATRQQDKDVPGGQACTAGVSFSAPWRRSCSAARPPRPLPGRWTACTQAAPS